MKVNQTTLKSPKHLISSMIFDNPICIHWGCAGMKLIGLKRIATIRRKLSGGNPFKLDRIRDIAGARIIVDSLSDLRKVTQVYLKGDCSYQVKKNIDYISHPQAGGYRSHHVVLSHPEGIGTDRDQHFGQNIELQIRTHNQHIWATACEGVGFLHGLSYKHELFKHMSYILASKDGLPVDGLSDHIAAIQNIAKKLDAVKELHMARRMAVTPSIYGDGWVLLNYDEDRENPTIVDYFEVYNEAVEKYINAERINLNTNTVLIGLSSGFKLRDAYPNYFIDLLEFNEVLKECLTGKRIFALGGITKYARDAVKSFTKDSKFISPRKR